MSLEKWVEYGWLKAEPSSPEEIGALLGIVTRALKDADVEAISDDLRFQAAFSAALTAATSRCERVVIARGCRRGTIKRWLNLWNSP